MRSEYTGAQGQYLGVEMILFGRRSFWYTEQALTAGRASGIDVPLGALLTPFAIVRTPLRLWGDTLFDPFGGALIAVGLAAAVLRRPTRTALLVLGLVAAGGALALASAGDRVSHTRMIAAVVPLVLFAAAGFEVLRRSLPGRSAGAATVGTALAVMLAGVVLFDRVGPRILPASAVEVALETRAASAAEPDAVLLHHAPPWMHDERIATQLPARPLPAVAYPTFAAGDLWAETMPDRVYFWSPALDQVSNVTNTVCDRWPDVALYAVRDGTGSVAVFAAAPAATGWEPGLPARRWTTVRCS
jgi:hypothetical protein